MQVFLLFQLWTFKSVQLISVKGVYWKVTQGSKDGEMPSQSYKAT